PRRENRTPPGHRPVKITFGEMRAMGMRGVLIYCADYLCSHNLALGADRWPDELRLSDIEPRLLCAATAGQRFRPDFNWNRRVVAAIGFRNTGQP
ncbi:hypothetical protein, partial [Bradyrhizobium sp. UFLA05-109]